MITSSLAFSWNGHHQSITNNLDTLNNEFVEFNITELDSNLVLVPIQNIKNANALYFYQNRQIQNYKDKHLH